MTAATLGSSFKNSKMLSKEFTKSNPKFKDKDYCKHFNYRYWCSEYGCYYYWCPLSQCYYYWYEPYSCYCPIEYVTIAPPLVVVTQPVVTVETVTTTVATPVVVTASTPIVRRPQLRSPRRLHRLRVLCPEWFR